MSSSTYDSQARHPWRPVLASQSSALRRAARDRLGPLSKGRNAARGLPEATLRASEEQVSCTPRIQFQDSGLEVCIGDECDEDGRVTMTTTTWPWDIVMGPGHPCDPRSPDREIFGRSSNPRHRKSAKTQR